MLTSSPSQVRSNRSRRALAAAIAANSCLLAVDPPTHADVVTATWNGGGGSWSQAELWSSAVVPGNNGTSTFRVFIDGGRTSIASVVTFDVSATIDTLWVDAGDSLVDPSAGQTLFAVGGAVVNNGTISLHHVGYLNGIDLSGAGRLTLNDPAAILAGSGALHNATAHTIDGAGAIGNPSDPAAITNDGKILSNLMPSSTMNIYAGTGSFAVVNKGLIQALNASDLKIYGDVSNTGTIDAAANGSWIFLNGTFSGGTYKSSAIGSTLMLEAGNIQSGTISNTNDGSVLIVAGSSLITDSISNAFGSVVTIEQSVNIDGGTLTNADGGTIQIAPKFGVSAPSVVKNVTVSGQFTLAGVAARLTGTVQNNGTIQFNANTSVDVNADLTLSGKGTARFNGFNNPIGDSSGLAHVLTNSISHTFAGGGSIGLGQLKIVNQGTLAADTNATVMSISPAAPGLTNTGTMLAKSGGILQLDDGAPGDASSPVVYQHNGLIQLTGATSRVEVLNGVTLTGSGSIIADAGTLALKGGSALQTTGPITVRNGAKMNVDDGALVAGPSITVDATSKITLAGSGLYGPSINNAGTIAGSGTILASVINNGTVSADAVQTLAFESTLSGAGKYSGSIIADGTFQGGASIGDITVNGTLTLGPSSNTLLRVGNGTAGVISDRILTTAVNLAGTLTVQTSGGDVIPGQSFDVVHYASQTGDIAVSCILPHPGLWVEKSYSATQLSLLVKALGGDANMDGVVSTADFQAMASAFNQQGQNWTNGDFTGDGKINAMDFNVLATNFGSSVTGSQPARGAAIPEPGTLAILTSSMILRRRRK